MLKLVMTAAAALLLASAAQAQKADEFRIVALNEDAAAMVSTLVIGPQNDRHFTEILVRRERAPSGADAYRIDTIVDCNAGTVAIGDVTVYQDDEVLRKVPRDPTQVSKPDEGSVAEAVFDYACTGVTPKGETATVSGVPGAIAYGRQRLGLAD